MASFHYSVTLVSFLSVGFCIRISPLADLTAGTPLASNLRWESTGGCAQRTCQPEELVLKRLFETDRTRKMSDPNNLCGNLALVLVMVFCLSGGVFAQSARQLEGADASPLQSLELEKDLSPADGDTAHDIFAALAQAWQEEDHASLAALVAREGVEIAIAPDQERDTHYSPDQAFYFFKNLFQSSDTDSFTYLRLQQQNRGGLVHAVADWSYRRPGGDTAFGERLVIKLTHDASGWGLSEIRAIR